MVNEAVPQKVEIQVKHMAFTFEDFSQKTPAEGMAQQKEGGIDQQKEELNCAGERLAPIAFAELDQIKIEFSDRQAQNKAMIEPKELDRDIEMAQERSELPEMTRAQLGKKGKTILRRDSFKNIKPEKITIDNKVSSKDTLTAEEKLAAIFLEFEVSLSGKNVALDTSRFINMCRALLGQPKILLIWEEGLEFGAESKGNIRRLFGLTEGVTVLSITKNNSNLLHYDQIALMDSGTIIETISPWEALNDQDSLLHNFIKETESEAFDEHMKILEEFKGQRTQRSLSLALTLKNELSPGLPDKEALPLSLAREIGLRNPPENLNDMNFIDTEVSIQSKQCESQYNEPNWEPNSFSRDEEFRNLEDRRLNYLYQQKWKTMKQLNEKKSKT